MVYDKIENLGNYVRLLPNLTQFVDYLKNNDVESLPVGEHVISNDLILKVKEYIPRQRNEARWEAHEVFADVQYLVYGQELMGISSEDGMKPCDTYNPVSDSIHFDKSYQSVNFGLNGGTFMLLMPKEVHMPSLSDDVHNEKVRKIIAKVRI